MTLAPDPWAFALAAFDEPKQYWVPQPKQLRASEVARAVDELLYGGAAGGGKTEWLIQYVAAICERWDFSRAVIFRRVYPSLARSIVPRAKEVLASRARWNANEHTFTFPNGSVLELAHLQHEDTVLAHQGTEYVVVAFEELTEFLQSQYEYMLGRLRTARPGVRPHAIATTNPGGRGHKWVKRRFVKPAPEDVRPGDPIPEPGTPWRPAPTLEAPKPGLRCFLPATLEDNAALLEADPGYVDRLNANSNKALRKAYRTGDWDAIDAIEGALWDEAWLRWVQPADMVEFASVEYTVVGVDPAAKDRVTSDDTGIVVASRGSTWEEGRQVPRLWVRADRTCHESPAQWGRIACLAAIEYQADAIVAEDNQGGDMVEFVIRTAWSTLEREGRTAGRWPPRVERVHSRNGKAIRAEPIAQLYEDGAVVHVGRLEELEDQLLTWMPEDGESPDRLDALVHAAHYLIHPTQRRERVVVGQRWAGSRRR